MRFITSFFILLFAASAVLAQVREEGVMLQERTLAQSVSVYPNPAFDYIDINLDHLRASKVKVALYNIIGNEVYVEPEIIDEHHIRIRVKDFSSGYYLVALRDEQSNFRGTYKFLKR